MATGLPTDRKLDEKVVRAETALAEMVKAQKESENTVITAHESEKTEKTIEAKEEVVKPKEEEKKEENKDFDVWKHKYEVLVGKYNAEMPRMATENKELKSQITELQKAIEDVQSKVVAKEETVKENDVDSAISVIERELGADVSNALNKLLDSKTSNVPKQYEEKVSQLEKKVEIADKRQIITEKQAYLNVVKGLIPDLITKNENPKFLEFLSNVIPFSGGKTYEQRLHEADAQNDALSVVEIFNAFYAPSKSNGKKNDIEEILEHGKPKPKSHNVEEKKIYTKAEIKQFNQDVVRGKYTGMDKIRQELEDTYTRAQLEDRVR